MIKNNYNKQIKRGFSLLELLMGIGLMAILLLSANVLLFTSFKSARKAAAITIANSEGAYALKSMEQLIKYSRSATCNSSTRLTVSTLTNQSVIYELSAAKIASTSGTTRNLTTSRVRVTACSGTMFTCSADGRTVSICYFVENVNGTDVTTLAGAVSGDGVQFKTQVAMRNFGY